MKDKKQRKPCGFELAEKASLRSNCNKRAVGATAFFYVDGFLICILMGSNQHEDSCNCVPGKHDPEVKHAEQMALSDISELSLRERRSRGHKIVLHVTYQPCLKCAHVIVSKGVSQVYYRDSKPEDTTGIDYLIQHNVKVSNQWK